MEIYYSDIGDRRFLIIEGVRAIPLDEIKSFLYNPPNGGCNNSIAIILDESVSHLQDPNLIFAYENADALKDFIRENKVVKEDDEEEE